METRSTATQGYRSLVVDRTALIMYSKQPIGGTAQAQRIRERRGEGEERRREQNVASIVLEATPPSVGARYLHGRLGGDPLREQPALVHKPRVPRHRVGGTVNGCPRQPPGQLQRLFDTLLKGLVNRRARRRTRGRRGRRRHRQRRQRVTNAHSHGANEGGEGASARARRRHAPGGRRWGSSPRLHDGQ